MENKLDLRDVQSHFNHWRSTRVKREKIPDYLWKKVQLLIKQYSLHEITTALKINTHQLREHCKVDHPITFARAKIDASPISEIPSDPLPPIHHQKTCLIELRNERGMSLKITDFPVESLSFLIHPFVGR